MYSCSNGSYRRNRVQIGPEDWRGKGEGKKGEGKNKDEKKKGKKDEKAMEKKD